MLGKSMNGYYSSIRFGLFENKDDRDELVNEIKGLMDSNAGKARIFWTNRDKMDALLSKYPPEGQYDPNNSLLHDLFDTTFNPELELSYWWFTNFPVANGADLWKMEGAKGWLGMTVNWEFVFDLESSDYEIQRLGGKTPHEKRHREYVNDSMLVAESAVTSLSDQEFERYINEGMIVDRDETIKETHRSVIRDDIQWANDNMSAPKLLRRAVRQIKSLPNKYQRDKVALGIITRFFPEISPQHHAEVLKVIREVHNTMLTPGDMKKAKELNISKLRMLNQLKYRTLLESYDLWIACGMNEDLMKKLSRACMIYGLCAELPENWYWIDIKNLERLWWSMYRHIDSDWKAWIVKDMSSSADEIASYKRHYDECVNNGIPTFTSMQISKDTNWTPMMITPDLNVEGAICFDMNPSNKNAIKLKENWWLMQNQQESIISQVKEILKKLEFTNTKIYNQEKFYIVIDAKWNAKVLIGSFTGLDISAEADQHVDDFEDAIVAQVMNTLKEIWLKGAVIPTTAEDIEAKRKKELNERMNELESIKKGHLEELYSEENTVEFNKEKLLTSFRAGKVQVQCVDGRSVQQELVDPDQIIVHLPGGEYGLYSQLLWVMTEQMTWKDPKKVERIHNQIVQRILQESGWRKTMYSHTDDHSHGWDDWHPFPCGCGHANLQHMKADYGLWEHQDYLATMYNESTKHELKGSHVEKAVVVNQKRSDSDDTMSSLKNNVVGDSMVFTFDLDASLFLIDEMVNMSSGILWDNGLNADEIKQARKDKLVSHTMLTVWTHLWSARVHADAGRLFTAKPWPMWGWMEYWLF